MKRPLALFVIVFCCGIVSARLCEFVFWPVYCAAIGVLAAGILRFAPNLCIYCLIFLTGAILYIDNQTLPDANLLKYADRSVREYPAINGVIHSQPIHRNKKTEFVFAIREIQLCNKRYICRGKTMVYINGTKDFLCGDELIVRGNLYRLRGTSGRYLRRQGAAVIMNAKTAVYLRRSGDWRSTIKRAVFGFKEKLQKTIYKYFTVKEAAVVEAMVLGEKMNIPRYINNSMTKTGTVHILVVSGFNVGIIASVMIIAMKAMGIPKRPRLYAAGLLLVAYCFITGASTPVMRATIMAEVFLFSYFVKRETDIYNCCSFAALIILITDPSQLFDIGFQLSFASVLSIAFVYPRIKLLLPAGIPNLKLLRFITDGILVSFSAWIGTLGLIAYYFKIISPVTVLANIFIVPMASLITLCGLTLLIAETVCPISAGCVSYAVKPVIAALFIINNYLAELPGAYFYFGA